MLVSREGEDCRWCSTSHDAIVNQSASCYTIVFWEITLLQYREASENSRWRNSELFRKRCPPSSQTATVAPRCFPGLTFPDFDLTPKRNEKFGYCGLEMV